MLYGGQLIDKEMLGVLEYIYILYIYNVTYINMLYNIYLLY